MVADTLESHRKQPVAAKRLAKVKEAAETLHSMLQLREDRCNLILELQTPLLEPCENLVGGRLFPRLDAIDISVDFVVALRESRPSPCARGTSNRGQPAPARGVKGSSTGTFTRHLTQQVSSRLML